MRKHPSHYEQVPLSKPSNMQTIKSSLQEEQLRSIITRFIRQLYEAGGQSIRHVTVTLHGEPAFFSDNRNVNAISVRKIQGVTTLSYQDLDVDAPISSTITLVATENQKQPA